MTNFVTIFVNYDITKLLIKKGKSINFYLNLS